MSTNTNAELAALKANLESLSLSEVRRMAKENFGIASTRDHSKDDIITIIIGAVAKNNFASRAEGDIKPGWARIKLNNTNDYRSAIPVPINANGFECRIPFGVEVDVPIRVLESLTNAVEYRVGVNEYGERVHRFTDSYPFQIIGVVPGPDPRPGIEVAREARLRPKKRFCEQYGFYPTDKTFREFVQSGMFKLNAEEHKVG